MPKKKLNTSDFEDFFGSKNTSPNTSADTNPAPSDLDLNKPKPIESVVETKQPKPEVEAVQKTAPSEEPLKSTNLSKTKNGKRPKALSKNDRYSDKNIFKGLYLTQNLAKQLEGVGGLVGRTHSDLICEALEKLFSTKKYEEMIGLISKID